jgi:hypothetical protein
LGLRYTAGEKDPANFYKKKKNLNTEKFAGEKNEEREINKSNQPK